MGMEAIDKVYFSDAPMDTFFLEQKSQRDRQKRRKKLPEELPPDLRGPHGGRFSFLLNRGKEDRDELNDSLLTSRSSLLPQINETFNLIRNSLNTSLLNDGNSQQFIYQETKRNALDIIIALAKILYNSRIKEKIQHQGIILPKRLYIVLASNYKDLTSDVQFVPREWQIAANQEEYSRKMMNDSKEGITPLDSVDRTSSVSGARSHQAEDDTASARSVKDSPASTTEAGKQPGTRSKTRLADIAESKDEGTTPGPSKSDMQPVFSRSQLQPQPRKTRIERFVNVDRKSSKSKAVSCKMIQTRPQL